MMDTWEQECREYRDYLKKQHPHLFCPQKEAEMRELLRIARMSMNPKTHSAWFERVSRILDNKTQENSNA